METLIKKRFYPTIGESFLLLVQFYFLALAFGIPLGAIVGLSGRYLHLDSIFTTHFTFLVIYIVLFITIIYLGVKRFRATNAIDYQLNFKKVPISILLVASIVVIGAGIITEPLVALIPMPKSVEKIFEESFRPDIPNFLWAVLVAPIAEEILFRGIILEGFLKNYSPKKAVVWSALMFGIYHLNPWQAISATVGGLIIGWLYWRTKSLIPGIFLHAMNNLIAFSLLYFSPDSAGCLDLLKDSKVLYGLLLAASVILVFIGYHVLDKKFKSPTPVHADR